MIRFAVAAAGLAAVLFSTAMAAEMPARAMPRGVPVAATFLAPHVPAREVVSFPAPAMAKQAALEEDASGRVRVGSVRPVEKAAVADLAWTRAAGGYVARFVARSASAEGLRVRLDMATMPGAMEVRAQGSDGGVEAMTLDPYAGNEAWTPWTGGESQVIELFSPVRPAADAVRVGGVLHMTVSPFAKAAGTCTIPTACSSGDPAVDAAVAERKLSVMRLAFVDDGSGFVCTGTLINTDHFPAPYVLTANHCIFTAATASTLTTLWFYETADCALGGIKPGQVQVAGGAQLV